MSEERNPTPEEETTPVETPVVGASDEPATPVASAAVEEAVDDASATTDEANEGDEPASEATLTAEAANDEVVEETVEETVEEAVEETEVAEEVQTTPQPTSAAAAPEPTQTAGPKEYSPEYEVGGRSRRINIEVRLDEIDYKNVALLGRFLDPRGRILSRRKTRVSAKVQRRVVNAIKLARHIALLPYTADQTRIVRRRR